MKLSVAMCTYNGARFVREQLESIAAQTRPPDELVVCDDHSSDETTTIVGEFARIAPFPVLLHVNPENLGSTENFGVAVGLCGGDVIALCDQDDVWLPDKLMLCERAFASAPNVGLVFTDAEVVDENLCPLGYGLWECLRFGARERAEFERGAALEVLLTRYIVTGTAMAFRARFKDLVLPLREVDVQGFGLPVWGLIHDGWIGVLIAAAAEVMPIPEVTLKYRRHPGQQMGVDLPEGQAEPGGAPQTGRGAFGRAAFACEAERLVPVYERLVAKSADFDCGPAVEYLGAKIKHFRARADLPESRLRRAPHVLRELLSRRYSRFSNGVVSAARDLLLL